MSKLAGSDAYLISTWDLVAEATQRVGDFSNHFRYVLHREVDGSLGALRTGPTGPDVLAGEDPPVHAAHRRAFLRELSPTRVQELEPYVGTLADHMLDQLLAEPYPDAAASLTHPLPLRVMTERVMCCHEPDTAAIESWMLLGSQMTGGTMTLDELTQASAGIAGLAAWVEGELDTALRHPPDRGLLAAAVTAVRQGVLSFEQSAFTLMVFIGAGAETTTGLLGICVELLAREPELQDRLRSHPHLIPNFIEEVLRLEAPFRFHPRTATRSSPLAGVEIPEGSLLLLLWASANRDPAVFAAPDRLILDRPNSHLHFGFGRGVHHCIGAALSRMEVRVVLERLLRRTRSFCLPSDSQVRWGDSVWIRRADELPVALEPS